jgi:hypothetical protein
MWFCWKGGGGDGCGRGEEVGDVGVGRGEELGESLDELVADFLGVDLLEEFYFLMCK